VGFSTCGISDAISTSSPPSIFLPQCFSSWLSLSYLCSLCHLCISLLLFSCLPSDGNRQLPSGLFQALSHTRTHALTHSSLFTLSPCLSPSLVISPSFCLTPPEHTYLAVSVVLDQVGSPSECLGPNRHKIWRRTKASWDSLLHLFFFLPVHLPAFSGERISHCVFVFLP